MPFSVSCHTAVGYMLHKAHLAHYKAESDTAKYAIRVVAAVAIPVFAAIDIAAVVLSLGIYSFSHIDEPRDPLINALIMTMATPFILLATLSGAHSLAEVNYHSEADPVKVLQKAKELKQRVNDLKAGLKEYVASSNKNGVFLAIRSIYGVDSLTGDMLKEHGFSHRECLALQLVCYENSFPIFDAILTEERPANLLAKAMCYGNQMPLPALELILKECEGENPLGIDVNATFTVMSHTKSALEGCSDDLLVKALNWNLPRLAIHAARGLGHQNREGVWNIISAYVEKNLIHSTETELITLEKLNKLKWVFANIESFGEGFSARLMDQFHKSFIKSLEIRPYQDWSKSLYSNWWPFEQYVQCTNNYSFDLGLLHKLMQSLRDLKDREGWITYMLASCCPYKEKVAKYHEELQKQLSETPLLPPLRAITNAYLSPQYELRALPASAPDHD